jgi:very-short-patch-repair endonuclease
MRFAEREGNVSCRTATVESPDGLKATMVYGHAATLWRINLGWRRRKNKDQTGFVLDVERGYWARSDQEDADEEDPMSPRTARVIPYVEDRRNCLIFEPSDPSDTAFMASLQSALKNAIQAVFELEDGELAAEPLPSLDDRRAILLYESAEGGAGVLRRLVEDADATRKVAEAALDICHFDPATGEDLKRAPTSKEDCEAACYDCLLSYSNQPDHQVLDRKLIAGFLCELRDGAAQLSDGPRTRAALLAHLMAQAESELEREWLRFVEARGGRLPTHAQRQISDCNTRPDFIYRDLYCAIYVDGPHHDFPERAQRDRDQEASLMEAGWTVVRFPLQTEWESIANRHPDVFGGQP